MRIVALMMSGLTAAMVVVLMDTLIGVQISTAAFVMVWVVLACSVLSVVLTAVAMTRGGVVLLDSPATCRTLTLFGG